MAEDEGRGLGGAGIAGAAGLGILALLGGIGKFLARSGDDVARVAMHSGDDVGRAFAHGSDDLGRGAFRSGGQIPGPNSFDDLARVPGQTFDDLPRTFPRTSTPHFVGPHGQGWNYVDDVAVQEERIAENLGRVADPADAGAAKPGGGGRVRNVAPGKSGAANSNAAALSELLARTQRSRTQLSDQMEALRKLTQGTVPVEPQPVIELAARQHDRSLKVLTELHEVAEQAPIKRLEEAARAPAPLWSADDWAAPLATESRELAGQHGPGFFKHLLRAGERLYSPENRAEERDDRSALPALLKAAEADADYQLSPEQLQSLRQELGRVLSQADANLAVLEYQMPAVKRAWTSPAESLPDDPALLDAAVQATVIRLQLFYAARTTERFAEQLRQDVGAPSDLAP